ncbi:30S ribosomal protein S15 [Candidatus Woesearchaeota archaeon]|nr:30S ribosomal protein S15 [Candidatus Woesearchaeota archaeon]
MARMYSKKRGRAGSKKPLRTDKPTWVRYKAKEIELLISKIAKEGKAPSQIGLVLRDLYGVPSTKLITKKRVTQIMREKSVAPAVPEDLMALIRKNIMIKKHLERNKHDMTAVHGLELTESHIKRVVDYYKRTKKLAADWKYDPAKIKLMIE